MKAALFIKALRFLGKTSVRFTPPVSGYPVIKTRSRRFIK